MYRGPYFPGNGQMVVLHWCLVSYFNGGLQLLCFCHGSQASCASCGLVSPKGVWCIWLSCSGGLPCGRPMFGLGFMLRLAAISTELWLFLEGASFIEYLLQCELAHSSTFQLASALNDSAQEPLCTPLDYWFSVSATDCTDGKTCIWSLNINKLLKHIIKYNNKLYNGVFKHVLYTFLGNIWVSELCFYI